ncbi:MAG: acyloxyacyl hydrolase [Chlorobiaceae bacterium]
MYSGYRFRHISHAGLLDRPNSGINSNALVAGFSWFY